MNIVCSLCEEELERSIKLVAQTSDGYSLEMSEELCIECFKEILECFNKITLIPNYNSLERIGD